MRRIRHFFPGIVNQLVLALAMIALLPSTGRADVDCSSIAACAIPYGNPPDSYDPAFQANISSGPWSVALDLFSDADCQTFFDTASASGSNGIGLMTFEYVL